MTCRTTHYACDCVLKKMEELEAEKAAMLEVVRAAEGMINWDDFPELIQTTEREQRLYKALINYKASVGEK